MNISEKMLKLAEPKLKTKTLDNGFGYYNVSEFWERLDEVVGKSHYLVEYPGGASVQQLSNGQVMVGYTCRISLLDDSGKVALYREGCGGFSPVSLKDGNGFANLGAAYHNAEVAAFKNACKALGVFGTVSEDEKQTPAKRPASTAGTGAAGKSSKVVGVSLVTKGPFTTIREDKTTGLPVYKIGVCPIEDGKVNTTEAGELILYPNRYSKNAGDENMLKRALILCEKESKTLKVKVQLGSIRDGKMQYIFDSFVH